MMMLHVGELLRLKIFVYESNLNEVMYVVTSFDIQIFSGIL